MIEMMTRPQFATLPRLDEAIPRFVAAEAGRGVGLRTQDKYRRNVGHFATWLGTGATVADITLARITAYQAVLGARQLSPGGILQHLASIRAFCKWLLVMGYRADDPTALVRYPKHKIGLPDPLSSDELAAVAAAARAACPEGVHPYTRAAWPRHGLVIRFLLKSGARIGEAAAVRGRDLDLARGTVRLFGKGAKWRVVPLPAGLVTELRALRRKSTDALFVGMDGEVLGPKMVAHTFERWLPEQHRILGVHAHRLRHTYATELLRRGVDIRVIQQLLGHEDLRTTQIYTQLDDRRGGDAVQLLPDW
jgi:site-specific recombinase XerD